MAALLTVGTAALFKVAAFAREAFIASRFGLSSFTDAYFAFQQFPLILATFMFGAFGLAFAPAYAREKRHAGQVAWLPGLVAYGGIAGILLTVLTISLAPTISSVFNIAAGVNGQRTLVILSSCFTPVIWLGIWAGVAIADGKNLLAMFVTGLPYLLMTAVLVALYGSGKLDAFSLPVSFLAGFGVIGLLTLPSLIAKSRSLGDLAKSATPWSIPGFRPFLKQLGASSIENAGYSCNQLLLVYFVAHAGTGSVTANTCAMRVGMIGFTLLGQPLAQLVQAKLCSAPDGEQLAVLKRWLPAVAAAVLAFAALLLAFRTPVARLVYLHGSFSAPDLDKVIDIVPAWTAYFVVATLNAIIARYLFSTRQGSSYVRRQLVAYAAANLLRLMLRGSLGAPGVIWCSVVAEALALIIGLKKCFQDLPARPEMPGVAVAGAQHA